MLRVIESFGKSLNITQGHSFKVNKNGTIRKLGYGFLFAFRNKLCCISYRFRDENGVATRRWKQNGDTFSRFDRKPACDRQTDRQTS